MHGVSPQTGALATDFRFPDSWTDDKRLKGASTSEPCPVGMWDKAQHKLASSSRRYSLWALASRAAVLARKSHRGELTAIMEAKISGTEEGWFRIRIEEIGLRQRINLVSRPRHFDGRQWYFICPYTSRRVSVLWMPPGARYFASRQRWGRSVAYASQCLGPDDRAYRGKAKINSRLCSIGGFDPDEWDLPPKPKWMRWRTYNRLVEKFDRYEEVAEAGSLARLVKF